MIRSYRPELSGLVWTGSALVCVTLMMWVMMPMTSRRLFDSKTLILYEKISSYCRV